MTWNRWRILFFVAFYAAFAAHVALWHYWGQTSVGHLGFGEFFGTLQHGVITAGTIFSLVIFGHALLFGGWFCGWLCHWGMVQDAAIGLMRRFGIHPKMVRLDSRLVPWVWFLILIGQVVLVWLTQGPPATVSWNMSHTPVWSGVPRSILLICITTIISGFFLIYLFGERAFCRTICTFRLWFSWFDRFAPLRIRQTAACTSCAQECTTCCPMGIDVDGEIRAYGEIRDSACIKCNLCIDACPVRSLAPRFSRVMPTAADSSYTPPQPDLQPEAVRLASLFSLLVLILGAVKIGGNVSMSLGFIIGMVYLRLSAQQRTSIFEISVFAALTLAMIYRVDFHDLTSLGKGLGLIFIFLLLARLIPHPGWQEFVRERAQQRASSLSIAVLAFGIAILGGRELYNSWNLAQQQASLKSGDYQRLSCMLESFTNFSDNPAATLAELGKTRRRLNDLAGAEKAFRQSLSEKPDPIIFCHLIEVQRLLGSHEEAIQTLEKALGMFAESPDLLLQAALVALKQ
ncbi:MAG TPA: 4Fe-4S binding protein, partial [Candidatus Ozemobacteraceae bacterium]|nr:4Fe-4S binding protein [Candidatus Ozemobacteraceae bacterium]